jgi:hypothetical protein
MTNIKETALAYKAPETKNIVKLEIIPVDIELEDKTFTREDESTFKVTVFEFEGEEYRMPKTVLKQLKAQLEANPKLGNFKVTKEGEGMKTVYTVIPLK